LAAVEPVLRKALPETPFEYSFTTDAYAAKFGSEKQAGALTDFFTVLALFISCPGMFGLASFVAEQRTKEIGIRKVLGAGTFRLWGMLSAQFITPVLLAFAIASPVAWWYGSEWLEGFDYRTSFSWWIFAIAGAAVLMLTLAVVSARSISAALASPADSLRAQ